MFLFQSGGDSWEPIPIGYIIATYNPFLSVQSSVGTYKHQQDPRKFWWNGAVAVCCFTFIGAVYTYSVTKMKQSGDDISEEILLHEANLTKVFFNG